MKNDNLFDLEICILNCSIQTLILFILSAEILHLPLKWKLDLLKTEGNVFKDTKNRELQN